ncbi:MAG TPA: VOC family protein [Acidimicrobiales bacterium]|nr:VOC family protein [Acidimicrobiales bacterium]
MAGSDTEARAAERARLREAYLRPVGERPGSSARGLHHTALISGDVERTIAFYQGLLGFPLTEVIENRDYPGSTHFFFDIGNGNLLAFFDFPGLPLARAVEAYGGVQHIAISVAQSHLDAVRAALDDKGTPYLGPDRGLTDSIYVQDPDGVQIELLAQPLREMDGRHLGD